jgi:hypothetical protein
MTPLIQEFIKDSLDEGNYPPDLFKWFDISDVKIERVGEYFADKLNFSFLDNPLPFDKVAVVTVDSDGSKASIALCKDHKLKVEGILVITTIKHIEGNTYDLTPFVYRIVDRDDGSQDIDVVPIDNKGQALPEDSFDEKEKQCVHTCMGYVATFLDSLQHRSMTYHEPLRRSNHAKRLRQGKKPLYDWRTVVIEPAKPKREHQGGTHASPRHHERRGHWRQMKKSGKRVWVNSCKVGSPANGIVFHDYKVKGAA